MVFMLFTFKCWIFAFNAWFVKRVKSFNTVSFSHFRLAISSEHALLLVTDMCRLPFWGVTAEDKVYEETFAKPRNLKTAEENTVFSRLFLFLFSFASLSKLFQLIWDGPISRWGENGRTPEKTTWHTRKQNLAYLTCGQSGARTHSRHSGEMIEWLRNSALNRSATGAAF